MERVGLRNEPAIKYFIGGSLWWLLQGENTMLLQGENTMGQEGRGLSSWRWNVKGGDYQNEESLKRRSRWAWGAYDGRQGGMPKGGYYQKRYQKVESLGGSQGEHGGTKGREYFKRGIIRGKAKVSTGGGNQWRECQRNIFQGDPKGGYGNRKYLGGMSEGGHGVYQRGHC